jgi:hypothetical protein
MFLTSLIYARTVDSLPFLNYLPRLLAPWKREADAIFKDTLALFRHHFLGVKANIEKGKDAHCFAKYILELQGEYGLSDDEASFLAGAMYGAGSDTVRRQGGVIHSGLRKG